MGSDGADDKVQQNWNDHSHWWVAEFTDGVDPEYEEQIVPLVVNRLKDAGRVLDLGTGEGQIARALQSAGANVIGVDPFPGQIAVAANEVGEPPTGSQPQPGFRSRTLRSTRWLPAWCSNTSMRSMPPLLKLLGFCGPVGVSCFC